MSTESQPAGAATEGPLRRTVADGVATLTLDSPANRNALSSRMVDSLLDALREVADDRAVRAVVLTHTGTTFCAGADLAEATSGTATRGPEAVVELMTAIAELPQPVIARINGHVRAGGFGLVGAADLAVAGPAATFALTEARLGLAPAIISVALLGRMSQRAASRYFVTGETFDADRAAEIGLLTAAFATDDELQVAVDELVSALRRGSPQGLAASKALTTKDFRSRLVEAPDLVRASSELFASAEAQEGMLAFLQRRPPSWAQL